jgi:hypothetical protein
MLLLADRNFYSYGLWSKAIASGAKLLWGIESNLHLPFEQRLADGSFISTVCGPAGRSDCLPYKVRVIEYCLKNNDNTAGEQQTGADVQRILTNICDAESAPAEDLAGLYHEKRKIESLFGEFKQNLYSSTIIRSKTPLLAEQEIWGLIILHFAVRKITAQAGWKHRPEQSGRRIPGISVLKS